MFRRGARVATALLVVLALGGCAGDTPEPSQALATPTATPIFASDAEAAAAATAAYERYLQVSDLILAEGGEHPERIDEVAVGEAREQAIEGFEAARASGYKLIGTTKFDSLSVQTRTDSELSAYLCVDVSGTEVVDADGAIVTSPDRPTRTPFIANFVVESGRLVVSDREVWTGDNFC